MSLLTLDEQLFRQVNGLATSNPWLDHLGVFAAEWLIWFLLAVMLLMTLLPLWHHRQGTCDVVSALPNLKSGQAPASLRVAHASVMALVASVLALIGNQLVSLLVFWRDRPFVVLVDAIQLIPAPLTAKSFPSDHSTIAFALAVSVCLLRPRFGAFLLVAAGIVAWGRVFVGVHFPLDVAVGALVGAFWALVAYGIERRYNLMRPIARWYERACHRLVRTK